MKAITFFAATAGYFIVAYFIYTGVLLQCGLGPGGSAQCDANADRQAFSFAVGALVFYAVLSVGYWWPRGRSKG